MLTPRLSVETTELEAAQRALLDDFMTEHSVDDFVLWYYTPMALGFTRHLRAAATVYDVMDELSLFRFAPPGLLEREAELYRRANVVFTGGRSLYEAKRNRHPNVHLFPSSVDVAHFARARGEQQDPEDQASIPSPRLGFFGVIDERMDLALLEALADAHPDWHIVMIGPVVKIDAGELPRRQNIHYLGSRDYADLPRYAAGWDVALMPWARNDATRFISPTKTPEYLAAGLPVVSTPIADVVRPYGELGLVCIGETVDAFVLKIETALSQTPAARAAWQRRIDEFLERRSWDRTWEHMQREVASALAIDHVVQTAPATLEQDSAAAD